MFSCTTGVETSNSVDSNETTNKNKYNSNEIYYYGGLELIQETNLPLTGFLLDYDSKEGYLSRQTYFINGRKDGVSEEYFKNGSLKGSTTYVDGKIVGESTSYFENGRKEFEAYYKNGELDGRYVSWFENGQVHEISHYENGLMIGWQREFLENGEPLYEINLIDGNGGMTYIEPGTNIQVKRRYVGGKEVPPFKGKYRNSRKNEVSYENGESIAWIHFNKNNQKMREGNSKFSLSHGSRKSWYVNGNLKSEETFFFSQPDGLQQHWHENGQLARESKYDRGIFISQKCWDESGKIVECEDKIERPPASW